MAEAESREIAILFGANVVGKIDCIDKLRAIGDHAAMVARRQRSLAQALMQAKGIARARSGGDLRA